MADVLSFHFEGNPTRVRHNGQADTPVKVSFVNLNDSSTSPDRVCVLSREIFPVYHFHKGEVSVTRVVDSCCQSDLPIGQCLQVLDDDQMIDSSY